MKKAAIASFVAVSALMVSPGLLPHHAAAYAQGQVQMDPAEYAEYEAAGKQATPAAQAAAYEAYLQKYPKSAVKNDVLTRIMIAYSQADHAKAITAADNVLAVAPNNLQAYLFEVAFRTEAKDLDGAATYAQKGLAVKTKADGVSDADFAKQEAYATPYFYAAIGANALNKKDAPGAIAAYKSELAAYPADQAATPAVLQEDYYLATAYYQSTPPDYVNCTFYATRTASLAPDQFKAQFQPLATYCYKKYHGGVDGYDAVVAAAKANLNPPAGFTIKPAPTAADQVTALLATTSDADLPKLAIADKEYVLANGSKDQADKLFGTIKGKETEIPDSLVISATADSVQVAVSDDAVQAKTADFTFNMKEPLKTVPVVGSKVTLIGTYSSYSQSPLTIIMSDASVVVKSAAKKPAAKAPVRHR
jgi:hypothetical protein